MKKLILVIGASARDQLRWAVEHLYTLLILTPLVIGILYATVSRLASEAPTWQPSFQLSLSISAVFVLSLIGLSLTRAAAEIFHLRRPESMLDPLPVSLSTQLHAALLKRIARTVVVALVVLTVRALTGIEKTTGTPVLLPLSLLILVIALTEALSALNWIHWGHARSKFVAASSVLAVVFSSVLAGLLLVMMLRPLIVPVWIGRWLIMSGGLWVIFLYVLTRDVHRRWRASDIEYAKRLQAGSSLGVFGAGFLQRRFRRAVAMQVARDLQLTLRAFSSVVYVALFMFVLLLIVLVTVLTTGWLSTVAAVPGWFEVTWLPTVLAVKITCVLATASCSILVAVLVTYQLPYFWLERAVGTTAKDMWETKLLYTRVVSVAAPGVAWLIAVLSGTVPLSYALPLLLECFWLWWIVSTLIGALAFEIPDRPELAIVLMISFGAMVGLLVAVFWPVGIVLFALNGIRGLTLRGHSRAAFCLITEGD